MCECVRVCMFMGEGLWVYACVWVWGCGCGCVNVCMWVYVGVYVCITGVGGSKKRAFRISSIYWGKLVLRGTIIEIPKTPKISEHEAGSTQG